MRRLFFIAGEESGDTHGAALIEALHAQDPTIACVGYGGAQMAAAGMTLRENLVALAGIGLDFLTKLPRFAAIQRRIVAELYREPPAAVILIDYPGLNLRVAQAAKARGIPVIYFISPQVWAWGERRIELIRRVVDRMLVVFKFEEAFYRERGVAATFVGHPLLDRVRPLASRETFLQRLNLRASAPTVAFLPGSRPTEIRRHLPVVLEVARGLKYAMPELQCVLPRAAGLAPALFDPLRRRPELGITVVDGQPYECVASADAALVASGTATLEAALLQCPMLIFYKTSALTYLFARRLVRLPYIGLVNVVAGRQIVPEFVQHDAVEEAIVPPLHQLLTTPAQREAQRVSFRELRAQLGEPGACARAASEILSFLRQIV